MNFKLLKLRWHLSYILLYPLFVHIFISQYFLCLFVCLSLPLDSELLERLYAFSCFISCQQHPGGEKILSPLLVSGEEQECLFFLLRKAQEELLMSLTALPHSVETACFIGKCRGRTTHAHLSAICLPVRADCPQNIGILSLPWVSVQGRLESEDLYCPSSPGWVSLPHTGVKS